MVDDPHDIVERITIMEHGQPVTFVCCRCGMVHDAMDLDVMDCEIGALEAERDDLARAYRSAFASVVGRIERRKAAGRRNAQRIENATQERHNG